MSHLALLDEIATRGLTLAVSGSDLRLQGARDRIDAELVGRIREHKSDLLAHLTRPAERGLPLTGLQRSYLFGRGDLFEMGNVASYVYHEVEGCWDLDRLERALAAVVSAHDSLCSHFTQTAERVKVPAVEVRIGRNDLRGLDADTRQRRRTAIRDEWSHRVLPTDRAPMLAAAVTLLADDLMVLHVGHDGLVLDGPSMFLFFRQWWEQYEGSATPSDPAQELSFEAYTDALVAARSRAPYERSRRYWLDRLDRLAPHPDLPLRTSPSAIHRPRFTPRRVRMDAARWEALKRFAASEGLTPSALLLAGYAETLSVWGGGERFTLLSTFANRPPLHPRIMTAIGAFSDTMLVEMSVDRKLSFAQRARAVQAELRAGLDHRHFSGGEVLRELARRRGGNVEARMPFTFNSTLGYPVEGLDGSTLELFGPEVHSVSQTPQVWLNVFAMEQHGALVIQLDGVEELFPEGLLDGFTEAYQRLLDGLVDGAAWQHTRFDLLPAAQRARRESANDTTVPIPEVLLSELFLAQVDRAPDAVAIVTSTGCVNYGELHARAAHAAHWLREQGVGRDELVALAMTRGPEQIVGVLATLLAGAAYLPVDAGLPAQRREYMLRDGRVRTVLTNTAFVDEEGNRAVLPLDIRQPVPTGPVPQLDLLPGACPDDLAYVLYTSGTTGEPKGVMIRHRSVVNVVTDCNRRFDVGPADRFFGISAFNFDLSVYDIFGSLSAGAALVVPEHDRAMDPRHWLDLCASAGVSIWNSVPAIAGLLYEQAYADGADADLVRLRLVMMSGDRIPPELPATLNRFKPDLVVVSLGGPTETTIWNILHPVGKESDGSQSIPYGRPNSNNRAFVLDRDGLDMPDWVTGEICASGVGLARGYWGDEARTAERFQYDDERGERIYRTGDLGRYLPDGSIDIQGRKDFQIKVNGYRIEAGEVETRLVGLDGVHRAVVVRQEGATGDRLVAHLVAAGPTRPTEATIRERLRELLPEYMVPSQVVWHDDFPLTRNGKVDRSALVRVTPVRDAPTVVADADLADELEHWVAGLWRQVLDVPAVDAVSTLYELGGDSISAARILTVIRKQLGVTIPIHRLSEVDTVRAMARFVATARGETER
ncbi:amino acid adenylation domain-containing protein [Micromonospora sp. HNM0581]|uniref:non-ribosomal peptide synthetase n=1 Tax=Micromonospora sp. HNM0581 TaxID=2716341 RepID=UPI00146E3686|nr:non-ribosomal peptide synthetase [Micromonospora sp. HNM0581]NLU80646.1 amino acid adenylation domain-containing protein [Micromonospora sp. HNM0581]